MKKKLINLTALATVQLSNAILPLFIFPYALGVVGSDLYTKLVLSEAISLFLLTIVLYSFEVDGVAQVVGLNLKQDTRKISHLLSSITYLRILLFLCCFPVVILIVGLFNKSLIIPTIWWSLIPLSYAIQSNWLYQGLEQNTPPAIFTVLSRILVLILIFVNVNDKKDYVYIPLIIGSFYLLSAIFSLLYIIIVYKIPFVHVTARQLKNMLWTGKDVFMGNLSVILYRDINVIILGAFGSPASGIAAYSMAEKFVKAIQASIRPLNQLFFPAAIRLCKAANSPSREVFKALLKITWPQVLVLIILIITLIILYINISPYIGWLQRIDNINYVIQLAFIMSFATIIGVCNFMFGSAGLNALGARQYYFIAILITGATSFVLNIFLVNAAGSTGSAIGFVMGELILILLITRRYLR